MYLRLCGMSWSGRRVVGCAVVAVALVAAAVSPARAQVLYGSIVGNVTDASDAPVPGAPVTITHLESAQTREATTDARGATPSPPCLPGPTPCASRSPASRPSSAPASGSRSTPSPGSTSTRRRRLCRDRHGLRRAAAVADRSRGGPDRDRQPRSCRTCRCRSAATTSSCSSTCPGFTPPRCALGSTNPSRALSFNVNGASPSSNNTASTARARPTSGCRTSPPTCRRSNRSRRSTSSPTASTPSRGSPAARPSTCRSRAARTRFTGSAFEYHHNEHLRARRLLRAAGDRTRATSRTTSLAARSADRSCGTSCSSSGATRARSIARSSTRSHRCQLPRCGAAICPRGSPLYDPLTGNADGIRPHAVRRTIRFRPSGSTRHPGGSLTASRSRTCRALTGRCLRPTTTSPRLRSCSTGGRSTPNSI